MRVHVHFQSVGFCATATTLTRISSSVMLGTGTSCTPAVLPGCVIRAFMLFGTEADIFVSCPGCEDVEEAGPRVAGRVDLLSYMSCAYNAYMPVKIISG